MSATVSATTAPAMTMDHRNKFGMYCQRLSERPKIMKDVLVSNARTGVKQGVGLLNEKQEREKTKERDIWKNLEHEFMKNFDELQDAPDEIKFPVLGATHPGGRVFKTQEIGVKRKVKFITERHPFYLKDPNSPAPEYNCFYDKNLAHFFTRSAVQKKLKEQGLITDENIIREPYKTFKQYICKKRLPYGSNSLPPTQPTSPRPTKPKLRDEFADDDIKDFLKEKYNLQPEEVDEMYSGINKFLKNRDGNEEFEEVNRCRSPAKSPLPPLRCSTPLKLASFVTDYQQDLHASRMQVVVSKRKMLELQKKSKVIEQTLIKDKKFGDNKKQIKRDLEEMMLEKLRKHFIKKNQATFEKLNEKATTDLEKQILKKKNVDKWKKKFAAAFVEYKMTERKVKKDRQAIEAQARKRANEWLMNQRKETEKELDKKNRKMYAVQLKNLAEITSEKSARIAQLQIKCEFYEEKLENVKTENSQLDDKLNQLKNLQKKMKPGTLDALNY